MQGAVECEAMQYVGLLYEGGFQLRDELAMAILTDNALKDEVGKTTAYYGLLSGEYADYLVLVNNSGIIEKAVPLSNMDTWREVAASKEVLPAKQPLESNPKSHKSNAPIAVILCMLLVCFLVVLSTMLT